VNAKHIAHVSDAQAIPDIGVCLQIEVATITRVFICPFRCARGERESRRRAAGNRTARAQWIHARATAAPHNKPTIFIGGPPQWI
jgi:hypothetical protein